MRALRALRALARVELRQLARHRGRSLLILLLVTIPVAAVVGATTIVGILEPTAAERGAQAMGRAALRVEGVATWAEAQKARALLPAHSQVETVFVGAEEVRVPGRRLRARLVALEASALDEAGLAAGLLHVERGRAPANAGEVALSPVLLEGLGRAPGETVTLAYGAARMITGVVLDPENLDAPVVLRTPAHVEHRGVHGLLVGLPESDSEVVAAELRAAGFSVTTRAEAANEGDAFAVGVVFAASCIGFFEVALVIAAAFGVSLRRRQVEIGLLRAAGAPMAGISLSLLVSAAALALLGGLVGAALGVAGAAAVHPRLDGWSCRLVGSFEVPLEQVALAVLLGVLAAVLAAALPARQAARVPIREALGARRPLTTSSVVWLGLGLAMVVCGLALLLLVPRASAPTAALGVIGGPVLGILGFGACSPWLLDGLARRGGRLPLAWRLAVRDAGRFRARNGPVVTAVLAGMSMSVTVAVFVASLETAVDAFPASYRDDQLLIEGAGAEEVARRLAAELPAIAIAPLAAAYWHGEPVRARPIDGDRSAEPGTPRREWVACGDEDLLRALGAETGAEAFRAGKLLMLGAPAHEVELRAWLDGRALGRPATAGVALGQRTQGPAFVLSTASLEPLGFEPGPPLDRSLIPWLVRLEKPIDREILDRAQATATTAAGTTIDAALLQRPPVRGVYRWVLLVCTLTGLIVVAIATALSATESVADEWVLRTVGAAPSLLRKHLAARAGYLALLGCALAVPAGLITARALFGAVNVPLTFVMPWLDVLAVLFVLPALVYAGAWLVGPPARPRLVRG